MLINHGRLQSNRLPRLYNILHLQTSPPLRWSLTLIKHRPPPPLTRSISVSGHPPPYSFSTLNPNRRTRTYFWWPSPAVEWTHQSLGLKRGYHIHGQPRVRMKIQ
ncbi:hypothetical protein HanIR_Chr15g0737131 [Helianthus annuus]|nr:hypothetical protein HanIR_Chr15g0737131 [Helianthus annuus]